MIWYPMVWQISINFFYREITLTQIQSDSLSNGWILQQYFPQVFCLQFCVDKFPMYFRSLLVYVDVLRSGGASAHLQRRFCVRQRAAGQPWHEVGWGVDNPGRWRRCMKITFYSLVCNSLQASQSWKFWKIKEDYTLGYPFSDVSTTK